MMISPLTTRATVIISLYSTEDGRPAWHVEIKGKMPREKAIRRALQALWHQATHLWHKP